MVPTWEHMSDSKKRKKRKIDFFLFLGCFFVFSVHCVAQNRTGEWAVMFYNVENLFDLKDDPETLDEDFTPGGDRHWTYPRFQEKIMNLSKVLLNAAGWEPPAVIGLCEVENRYVLECLIRNTPLKAYPYQIIHKESPDDRGIDVALLYNESAFYPLRYEYIPLTGRDDSVVKTREILYLSGIVGETDTLHFFVNHWPSRYDGYLETQPLRNLAAKTLRSHLDRKLKKYPAAKVIVLGDFNDAPGDESIRRHLGAKPVAEAPVTAILNLSAPWEENDLGTIKYRSQWSVFDQIMVSSSLLDAPEGVYTKSEWAQIVRLPFLLEKDERYGGLKTKRAYTGYQYSGGFSDHLPVLLKLKKGY